MAVYVTVVLLTMLLLITAVFFTTSSSAKAQIKTAINIKQAYEAGNSRASDIYDKITGNQRPTINYVYTQDFDNSISYGQNGTSYSVNNSIITLTSTAGDPFIHMNNVTSFNPQEYRYITVKYRTNSSNIQNMDFFMIENPTDQTYAISQPLVTDGQWHELVIDLWSNNAVKNRSTITGWRWDWSNANSAGVIMDVDYIKISDTI